MKQFFIGVTGGQGVGKSTFCTKLRDKLKQTTNHNVSLVGGLGLELKQRGIPYGSAATLDGVATAYSIHLQREMHAPAGIVILDRCIVDALAYVECLNITSKAMTELLEKISISQARNLDFVISLEMTGRFYDTAATHEADELRRCVAGRVPSVITRCLVQSLTLNAADEAAVEQAAATVAKKANGKLL